MNWVTPIKDEETLQIFEEALKQSDLKYYIMFEIGVGTGLQLQDILKYRVKDLRGKEFLTVHIGTRQIELTYRIPEELQEIIRTYTKELGDEDYVFHGHRPTSPLTREQAYRALKAVSLQVGISSVGAQTMRKTFAWKYYKETGDIHFLQNLFNHATPSITYRFIGEKPSVDIVMKKMTAGENERSRQLLHRDGIARLQKLAEGLKEIEEALASGEKNDSYYGSVDCFLTQAEDLYEEFRSVVK